MFKKNHPNHFPYDSGWFTPKKNLLTGVSKNRGTPKWMVKIMENLIKMDDLGVPLWSETATCAGKFWFCDWKNFVSCQGSNPILPGSPKTKSRMPRRILVFSVGGISVRETPPGTHGFQKQWTCMGFCNHNDASRFMEDVFKKPQHSEILKNWSA